MELDEFHITNLSLRPVGHGDAVRRGDRGVGRIAIELPHSSRGQKHRARSDGRTSSKLHSANAIAIQQLRAEFKFVNRNILKSFCFGIEGA